MTRLTTVEEQRADLDRAAAGFEYDSSPMDDDVPHLLATDAGTRVEPPPCKLFELCTGELRAMHEEGCLGMLTMHPFLSGRPARARNLRRVIETIPELGNVWFATAGEIAAHTRRVANPDQARTLRSALDPLYGTTTERSPA